MPLASSQPNTVSDNILSHYQPNIISDKLLFHLHFHITN